MCRSLTRKIQISSVVDDSQNVNRNQNMAIDMKSTYSPLIG